MATKNAVRRTSVKSHVMSDAGQYDVREDEEQNKKCEETLQLLVTAGYFRARIKGLSAFDKVVGGMCWCIQGCNVDIDIDLLFQENSNIGQKISLTEKIVKVLKKMKCPHRIEPHQIQGSDFIHVFPVVQWLVKQAIASRDERMAAMKQFAGQQFDRKQAFVGAAIEGKEETAKTILDTLEHLQNTYRPQRRFRKPPAASRADEETQVATTLLEYGRKAGYFGGGGGSGGDEEAEASKEEEKLQNLMDSMARSGREDSRLGKGKLAAGIVGSILGQNVTEIHKTLDDYVKKRADLAEAIEREVLLQPAQHARKVAGLEERRSDLEQELQEGLAAYSAEQESSQKVVTEHAALQEQEKALIAELERLTALETEENKASIDRLNELMAATKALEEDNAAFRASCQTKLVALKEELALLRSGDQEKVAGLAAEAEAERVAELEAATAKVEHRLAKFRLAQAKKAREVNALQRQLEEAPSGWEVQQYQKRFLELYEQVTATHRQTKQYYELYNTLESTLGYLQKEVNLLNSIYETFEKAMATSQGREQFLVQMEQIVDNISRMKQMAEKRRETAKARRDAVNEEYMALVERERQYFQQVKDFQEECRRHEQLRARAAQAGLDL